MDRCPACRARMLNQPVCPRCACDFSLALDAETLARQHLAAAVRSIAIGDRTAARQSLAQSLALKRREISQVLAAHCG